MKKVKNQVNWLQVLIIFLLGILIASNVFLFLNLQEKDHQVDKLGEEIEKLKIDDITLAQVLNNLIAQLQANRIIQPPNNILPENQ